LLGHEEGAFKGATRAREGYFEQAEDGTLFLDEIGDLSLLSQVMLLRVLQQMEFTPLGSSKRIPLRARLIFATHRDLPKLVAEGKFREDLFNRINALRIDSPALKEHPEDIPILAQHFLRHYSKSFQKPMDGIEPDAMELLQNYDWPYNVRELENVLQRAIILAPGQLVRIEDLTLHIMEEEAADLEDFADIGEYSVASSFEQQLLDYKIKLALDAVRANNGNSKLAAGSLRLSKAYLHRLIRLADPDAISESAQRDDKVRQAVNAVQI
jgi:DNA-binding NtrC family response regulator